MRYAYPADVQTDEAGFVLVTVPDVPAAGADGESLAEALAEAATSLGAALAGYIKAGRQLPAPSPAAANQYVVAVPFDVAATMALRNAMARQGVNNSDMARRLGVGERVVRRMVDPDHPSKPQRMLAALAILGHDLIVEDRSFNNAA